MNTRLAVLLIVTLVILVVYMYPNQIKQEHFTVSPNKYDNKPVYPFQRCYVINLTETEEGKKRWQAVQRHVLLKQFAIRFPGIYGKTYDYSKEVLNGTVTTHWDYGSWKGQPRKMVPLDHGEIGVILSHRNVWHKIVRERIPVTLVLEDDATRIRKDFLARISYYLQKLPPDWDILLAGFQVIQHRPGTRINNDIYRVKHFILLHSYLISYRGAQKLLKLGIIDQPLDTWLSTHSDKINIYRHDLTRNKTENPYSILIRQSSKANSQINHTNNW